jgi:hemerythrin-like domain-containing protein
MSITWLLHLAKENHRLFMVADVILQSRADQINSELAQTEEAKLKELGKTRSHYKQRLGDIESSLQQDFYKVTPS